MKAQNLSQHLSWESATARDHQLPLSSPLVKTVQCSITFPTLNMQEAALTASFSELKSLGHLIGLEKALRNITVVLDNLESVYVCV